MASNDKVNCIRKVNRKMAEHSVDIRILGKSRGAIVRHRNNIIEFESRTTALDYVWGVYFGAVGA